MHGAQAMDASSELAGRLVRLNRFFHHNLTKILPRVVIFVPFAMRPTTKSS